MNRPGRLWLRDADEKVLTLTSRRWVRSHFGEVAAAVASVSLIYPSLAGGSGFSGRGLWWWLCLAAAVVGIVGALIHNLRLQPTREELLRQSDRLSEHQKRWNLELHGALEVVARRLFEDIVTKTSEARLSVYYHRDKYFVQVCRLSGNPDLRVTGRGRYSDSQGIISDAWKKGVTSVVKLSSDRDEWVQECVDSYGMDIADAQKVAIRMQSRSFVAKRIDDGHEPIGVVLFESLAPLGVNNATFDQLEGEGASMLLEVLTEILGVVRGSLDSEQELVPVGRT